MEVKLYNSLSNKIEEFKPIQQKYDYSKLM